MNSETERSTVFEGSGAIFLLPVHLSSAQYNSWVSELKSHGATIAGDITAAQIVLANLNSPQRAEMEINRRIGTKRVDFSVLKLAWARACMANRSIQSQNGFVLYAGSAKPEPSQLREMKRRYHSVSGRSADPALKPDPTEITKPPRKVARKQAGSFKEIDPIYLQRYSCLRPHPLVCENEELSSILKEIRYLRDLDSKEVSVRAYSSAIASIRSYPYKIQSADEISRLPGCGAKIVKLVKEYLDTGAIESETSKLNTPEMQSIKTLSEIWGVGGRTAYSWYHNKGWRTLDDIKRSGFSGLSKAQKCGVIHYDEFLVELTHSEVKSIGDIIVEHAKALYPEAQGVICGSYRRGAQSHRDVDIVLSVPKSQPGTQHALLEVLIRSLKTNKYLSEVLTVSGGQQKSAGMSLLDFALVVWSSQPTPTLPLKISRVDIICVDWSVVGCAIVGWTGGTTFERDLRMYCKARGLKCTSAGIFDRNSSQLLDTSAATLELSEKAVFDLLELPYFPPELRNTG